MARSSGHSLQKGVITVMLFCILSTIGSSSPTDQPECKDVQCPSLDTISCPDDSNVRFVSLSSVMGSKTLDLISRQRRNTIAETMEKTVELATETSPTAETITEGHASMVFNSTASMDFQNISTSISSIERCCSKAICVCKEICNIPSCHNTSLVLIETKKRSNIPGQCCAEFTCNYEPNCSEIINTNGSWLTDCQVCQCVAGQKICHRSCDEMRPHPANCLSQNLKRSFSNGESWKEDECTMCECVNGEKKCLTSFCKALNCENKIKLSGECCPICVDPVTSEETSTSSSTSTQPSVIVKPVPTAIPPCKDAHDTIVHVIEPNSEKCILYALIACLAIVAAIFIGLYCHARSRQRSYRPVPIFDSNFNKIKSIVTS